MQHIVCSPALHCSEFQAITLARVSTRLHFGYSGNSQLRWGENHFAFIFLILGNTSIGALPFFPCTAKHYIPQIIFLQHQQAPEFMFIAALGQMKHKTAAV